MEKEKFKRIVVNATPHPITFRFPDGEDITINPSGYKVDADTVEEKVAQIDGIHLVRTLFQPTEKGEAELKKIGSEKIVIESIISGRE